MANLPELPRIAVKGPFWSAEVDVIGVDAPRVPTIPLSFEESFDAYEIGDDPVGWRDTKANNSFNEEDELFKIFLLGDQKVFGTQSEKTNIHTHYVGSGALDWQNYVFRGRFFVSKEKGGIGVTFLSHFPNGEDSYYRLRATASKQTFHIAPHPHNQRTVHPDGADSEIKPVPNAWHWFHIEVEDTGTRTDIRAKIWVEGESEPPSFQINTFDDSPDRLMTGTVGLWTGHIGEKYFDSLSVSSLGAHPVIDLRATQFEEDFEDTEVGAGPLEWRDTEANNSFDEDDSLFQTFLQGGQKVFGTTSDETNIHTHYVNDTALNWTNYIYRGRMLVTEADGGIGVTFFSRFPENEDSYYRLRTTKSKQSFHIAPHPHDQRTVHPDGADSGIAPVANEWHWFHVEVTDTELQTTIRAKIWLEGEDEPTSFQIDTFDDSPDRLRAGTIGLWAGHDGEKYFDNLSVQTAVPTVPALQSLFLETQAQDVLETENVYVPGTVLALCRPVSVVVDPTLTGNPVYQWEHQGAEALPLGLRLQDLRSHLATGEISLLVLATNATDWPASLAPLPTFQCLSGEINLDILDALSAADESLYANVQLTPAEVPEATTDRGLRGALTAHSSGLTLYGGVRLPWMVADQQVLAPFELAKTENAGDDAPAFLLSIEEERLSAEERRELIRVWRELSIFINPRNPIHGPGFEGHPTTIWSTLEISRPLDVPEIFWILEGWGLDPKIRFGAGEINVLLSDKRLYNQERPPTSLASVVPTEDIPMVVSQDGNELRITLTAGGELEDDERILTYQAQREVEGEDERYGESIDFPEMVLAFDPVETPRRLRTLLERPIPKGISGEGDTLEKEPVLWGFSPLEDGWLQLPVPNMTEQLFFRALPVREDEETEDDDVGVLRGAVAFGNGAAESLATFENEQPWDLTLTDAEAIEASWDLVRGDDGEFSVERVTIRLKEPVVLANGFLWFATSQPTVADALPGLQNWVAGLEQFPLRPLSQLPLSFPPLVECAFEPIRIALRADDEETISASLENWVCAYRIAEERLSAFSDLSAIQEEVERHLPLAWRRHRNLPTIQNMPLTQSQSPPNAPSGSRQLAPYKVDVEALAWRFGATVAEGSDASVAAIWPTVIDSLIPAPEWVERDDLAMVALSIPGIYFAPFLEEHPQVISLEGDRIGFGYRFDLPYTDQLNALAQLPREPRDPDEVSPLPDSPIPEPVVPLQRDALQDFWKRLSELASLASVSAAEGLDAHDDEAFLVNLVEPFRWPVTVVLDASQYPGSIEFQNAEGATNVRLLLSGEEALEGIGGAFQREADGHILLTEEHMPADAATEVFKLLAGSMQTSISPSAIRDQRGLARGLTVSDPGMPGVLMTDVAFSVKSEEGLESQQFRLTSLTQSMELTLPGGTVWDFWFKDLPVKHESNGEGATLIGAFERSSVLSSVLKDSEADHVGLNGSIAAVNDPEALASHQDFKLGYEWRLGGRSDNAVASGQATPLDLNGLVFFPLTLESVTCTEEGITQIELVGRLQLPLTGMEMRGQEIELTDFSNAVRLTFQKEGGASDALQLSSVAMESQAVRWPLALRDGEQANAPVIEWSKIVQREDGALVIGEASSLNYAAFQLFGRNWRIPLQPFVFLPADHADAGSAKISGNYAFEHGDDELTIAPQQFSVDLDLQTGQHQAQLDVSLRVGDPAEPAFAAIISYNLVQTTAGVSEDESQDPPPASLPVVQADSNLLFGKLTPELAEQHIEFEEGIIQLSWPQCSISASTDAIALEFLPGMGIQIEGCPGFLALTFDATAADPNEETQIPQLTLSTGFMEQILECRWGAFLQEDLLASETAGAASDNVRIADGEQAFGSSAGALTVGFSTEWGVGGPATPDSEEEQEAAWNATYLLNGFVELIDLISWPSDAQINEEQKTVSIPSADSESLLAHARHSLRILLNQQELPVDVLMFSADANQDGGLPVTLFSLRPEKGWQFLAVVEHQILNAGLTVPAAEAANLDAPGISYTRDVRWAAVQEVRFISPSAYHEFIAEFDGEVFDSEQAVASRQSLFGHFQAGWVSLLTDGEGPSSLSSLPSNTLLVEASAVHWVRTNSVERRLAENASGNLGANTSIPATALQFLSFGSQNAMLSSLEDFGPSDTAVPEWQLIRMPFLGRLQTAERDGLQGQHSVGDHPFLVDPVLQLWRTLATTSQQVNDLVQMMTSRLQNGAVELAFSEADHALASTLNRLDPHSLEESWFRLQNPLQEPEFSSLQSVLSTRPDSPAQLSRSTMLAQVFRSDREAYPPGLQQEPASSSVSITDAIPVWRTQHQLVWQHPSGNSAHLLFPWLLPGFALLSGNLLQGEGSSTQHFATATQLPVSVGDQNGNSVSPASLAVSPYIGLAFAPAPEDRTVELGSIELLAVDLDSQKLRPIASQLREQDREEGEVIEEEADVESVTIWAKNWARETLFRLRPDSALGVVRIRFLLRGAANQAGPGERQAPVITRYAFKLVDIRKSESPIRPNPFLLRSKVAEIRYRSGQFGGSRVPERIKAYELAPPIAASVQPVYVVPRHEEGALPPERPPHTPEWPFGISGLSAEVQYTGGKEGVEGTEHVGIAGASPSADGGDQHEMTLWWHAAQHHVQFRSALSDLGPVGSLPKLFRAVPIKSLLPARTSLALPTSQALNASDPEDLIQNWQPVMPGSMNYVLIGSRPGSMLSMRNTLIRQSSVLGDTATDDNSTPADIPLVSGAIPAQYRVPRPVPLPPNFKGSEHIALQTWASYLTPQETVSAMATPEDEAFFAPCGEDARQVLRMKVETPALGAITAAWNGQITFALGGAAEQDVSLADWDIDVFVVDEFENFQLDLVSEDATSRQATWRVVSDELERLRERLSFNAPGEEITIQAEVKPTSATSDFRQELSFKLRIFDEKDVALPVRPRFLYFEDPEYNRRLISLSGSANKPVVKFQGEERILAALTLSSDRREYNPGSTIALRYDWDDEELQQDSQASISFQRLDQNNIPLDLSFADQPDVMEISSVRSGRFQLLQLSLSNLQAGDEQNPIKLRPGDSLLIKVKILKDLDGNNSLLEDEELVLSVDIIEEPVIPLPEAGYAVLKSQLFDGNHEVECTQFAWGPEATRVELICPEDLREEVVRRRAVFKWQDAVRPGRDDQYQVQKIAFNGATHFPGFSRE